MEIAANIIIIIIIIIIRKIKHMKQYFTTESGWFFRMKALQTNILTKC
jgi:hypothetical protein